MEAFIGLRESIETKKENMSGNQNVLSRTLIEYKICKKGSICEEHCFCLRTDNEFPLYDCAKRKSISKLL